MEGGIERLYRHLLLVLGGSPLPRPFGMSLVCVTDHLQET